MSDAGIVLYNLSVTLRILRKSKGLTQRGLAVETGVDEKLISRIENASGNPSLDSLCKLCKFFKLSLSELFAYNGYK